MVDIAKYQLYSAKDTFKNSTVKTQTLTVPSHSFTAGEGFHEDVFTISVSNGINLSQIKAQFSFDSGKWYVVPSSQHTVNSKVKANIFARYTTDNLKITVLTYAVGVSPWSFTSFTVDIDAKVFLIPHS